ncbi:MAG TPA: tRNA glutamyl-Q(34) synthetase GluQRS [Xanthobacteraceae bacterium]|nr:tRNA glutamyl-Q(34) synthetase GluQRS [Xanthobacteraceae bacterium]
MPPVFRFAPSPNGYLHLGHAYSALLNFDRARAAGGRLLLRVEDIDLARCRPEFEAAIYEDLAWLGVTWEQPVRRQSEHFSAYRDALATLEAADLVYATFESRGEIAGRVAALENERGSWPHDPDGAPVYPGNRDEMTDRERAQRMRSGEPYALRLDMRMASGRVGTLEWTETGAGPNGETGTIAAEPVAWGDVILARKDIPTSYHLSVVVDDALQEVTDIVRGHDLFAATSVHRLLQALLGLPQPRYHHHRLILDSDGRKLSKSSRSTALRALRADGLSPSTIRRLVGLQEPADDQQS